MLKLAGLPESGQTTLYDGTYWRMHLKDQYSWLYVYVEIEPFSR